MAPAEAGEIPLTDAHLLVAQLARERREEDRKWDRRMLGVCRAIRSFAGWAVGGEFDESVFYPSLFEPGQKRGGVMTDPNEMQPVLIAFAMKAAGKKPNEETDHG